jgi:hypothetical protein
MKRMILTLAVTAGILCASQAARATPLTPGQTALPTPPPTLPYSPTSVSNTITEQFTTPGSGGVGQVTGTVTEQVVVDKNNPGGLDFVYQFTVTSTNPANSGDGVSNLIGQSFATPVTVDASQVDTSGIGSQVASDYVHRSSGLGSTVTFNFGALGGTTVGVGQTSDLLIVRTNATLYTTGTTDIGLTDGGTVNVHGFHPLVATPEPASLALFGTCFAGLGLIGVGRFLRRKPAATIAA